MAIQTINPATNQIIKDFNEFSDQEIQEVIKNAHFAFREWKKTTFTERAELLRKAAEKLRERKGEYAELMTLEMGKPINQAEAEVDKSAWVCEYYAENAESFLAKEYIKTDASQSYVRFDPLGVVLAVMPWNFPFWQVFRFAAPALMAGNTGLLKHASNVPMCAIAIESVFKEVGFPENVFTTLLVGSSKVKQIIDYNFVKAATLTGSEIAGSKVASACGHNLKKTVMELGGSDPFVVLEDADLKEAANWGVTSRMINNGQSCIAAKRFIVVEEVYEKFLELFTGKMKTIKVGDPLERDTDLGPVARQDLMDELHDQVKRSEKAGANILLGGEPIDMEGAYYPPTIIEVTNENQPAYSEELFGPVAIFIKAVNTEDALRIANDTEFGLGASIWTANTDKGEEYAELIESGAVFINGMTKSDPRLPFGGVKISGYGRELSHYGIREFVNIKSVWVK